MLNHDHISDTDPDLVRQWKQILVDWGSPHASSISVETARSLHNVAQVRCPSPLKQEFLLSDSTGSGEDSLPSNDFQNDPSEELHQVSLVKPRKQWGIVAKMKEERLSTVALVLDVEPSESAL